MGGSFPHLEYAEQDVIIKYGALLLHGLLHHSSLTEELIQKQLHEDGRPYLIQFTEGACWRW